VASGAFVGVLVERVILRRMVGQPVFAVIILTIGLLFFMEQFVSSVWGFDNLNMDDPWGIDTTRIADIVFAHKQVATLVISAVVLTAFFAYFKYSVMGVSMRAVALDQEAALAQGISARTVFAVSWAIAGGVAALAGVMQGSGPAAVEPGISFVALRAFPAMILGGLDSPGGAVVGGLTIGIVQNLTAGYQPDIAPWLGSNFHLVMPYVVMVLILLVRPYGLWGTPEVHRA
jgi:branched-chain amino acid transport system permease protein